MRPQQCADVVQSNLLLLGDRRLLFEVLAQLELAARPRALAKYVAFATTGKPLFAVVAQEMVGDLA